MSEKSKLFISCEEASHVCDKTQYKEASLWEKIKLNIHLLYCRVCREYSKNNQKLTTVISKSEVTCLDTRTKETLKEEFEVELEKQQF
jgi:hypothetical protein